MSVPKTKLGIKRKTPLPQNITESEFYRNYLHGKALNLSANKQSFDPVTGHSYPTGAPQQFPKIESEGNAHWNTKRFLIQPQYLGKSGESRYSGREPVPAQYPDQNNQHQRKMNAYQDVYRYNLSQNDNQRNPAWKETKQFMKENVNSLVKGPFFGIMKNNRLYGTPALDNVIKTPGAFDKPNTPVKNKLVEAANDTNDKLRYNKNPSLDPMFTKMLKVQNTPERRVRKGELKRANMDYLTNWRGNTRPEAKTLTKESMSKFVPYRKTK